MAVLRPWHALALALLALSVCSTSVAQTGPARTVLTIYLGVENHPSNPLLDAGIRKGLALRSGVRINYATEYLESESFAPTVASAALAEYIARKYRGQRIDVVIAMADAALEFVRTYRSELFPDAAIVFSGLSRPDESLRRAGRGLTGVIVAIAHAETLKVALMLHPGTERVYVIANSSDPEASRRVHAAIADYSRVVTLVYMNEPTLPRLLSAVRAVPSRSLILYVWHAQEEPGNVMYPDEVAELVTGASPVPVYGTSDLYIGRGVVGGVVRKTGDTGIRVGEMARQILEGTPAQDLPIETASVKAIFDWRQLRRWGIAASSLPPKSEIQFRTPTAWESFGRYIVALVIIIGAELLLIAGLLRQRTRRRRAEETIRRREASLRKSYDRIRRLAGGLITAQETTRAGIARELHDGVCQELAAVATALTTLRGSSCAIQDSEAQRAFEKLEQETFGVFESVRRLSHDLHPETLRILGLTAALKTHCSEVANRNAVQVNFDMDGEIGRLNPDVAVCLFRIAQESLRNGIVHGQAKRLDVSLGRSGDSVELTVTDDGNGFDVAVLLGDGVGLGLVSIQERARLVGGQVKVASAPGRGTTVRVRTPAVPTTEVSALLDG